MSGGESASVPSYPFDHYETGGIDYSADFSLYYKRGSYTTAGIEIENQAPGVVKILKSAMDATRQKIAFQVEGLSSGVAEIIVRPTTTSGASYPVKYVLTVRVL